MLRALGSQGWGHPWGQLGKQVEKQNATGIAGATLLNVSASEPL